MKPPAGRPHQPTLPHGRLRSSILKVGFAIWCFFFGYFVGIFHHNAMYAVEPSSKGAQPVAPLLSWPPTSPASQDHANAHLRNVKDETTPLPAASFPLCDGQAEKEDASTIYKKGTLKPPPVPIADPAVLRTYRQTRESILQGIRPASVAHQQLLDWCDWESQRSYFLHMPPPAVGYSAEFVLTQHCAGFNPHCMANGTERAKMSRESLVAQFEADFIPPKFYPNMSALGALVKGNSFAMEVREMMIAEDWENVIDVSRGKNVVAPEVGILYGGYVTQYGTIFSPHLVIPAWPDEPRGDLWPTFLEQYMGANSTEKWRDVKEVLVITHHHQEMFWHWIINEAYRLFVALPYLRVHPDIFIHISGGPAYAQKYERMFNIPRWRFLSGENVRADVVYVLQNIERSDVPSLGMAQLTRHGLLDMNDLPLDRRRSVMAKPRTPSAAVEQLDEAVVTIVFIVRTDAFTGRMILNHKELYKAVEQLARDFPKRFADQKKGRPASPKRLKIELTEHVGSMSMVESRKLFGRADIVIGPHGAGLGYHAIFPNLTKEGLVEGSPSHNFVADVPSMVAIVESILTERFLP